MRPLLTALGALLLVSNSLTALAQKAELIVQSGHTDLSSTVLFGLGGKLIVSSGRDRTIKVWNAETGGLLKTLTGLDGWHVQVSPDGKLLAAVVLNQIIKVWSLESGQELHTLKPTYKETSLPDKESNVEVGSLFFSSDGRRLYGQFSVGLNKQAIYLVQSWDLTSEHSETHVLAGATGLTGTFSPDASLLVDTDYLEKNAEKNSKFTVWNTATGQVVYSFLFPGVASEVKFNRDGRLMLAESDNQVALWDARTGRQLSTIAAPGFLGDVGLSDSGRYLIGNVQIGVQPKATYQLFIWDINSGRPVRQFYLGSGYVNFVSYAWSPDEQTIACQLETDLESSTPSKPIYGTVRLWDVQSGKLTEEFHPLESELSSDFNWSPDGKYLVSTGNNASIYLWDPATGRKLQTLAGQSRFVSYVAYSPDGNYFASESSTAATEVVIWDLRVGSPLFRINGEFRKFSADSKLVVIETKDVDREFGKNSMYEVGGGPPAEGAETQLWSISGRAMLASFYGPLLYLSADSRQVMTRSRAAGVVLWDVNTKTKLRTLATFHDETSFAIASDDGAYLLSGWNDGKIIRLIDVASGRAVRTFDGFPLRDSDDSGDIGYEYAAAFSHDNRLLACRRGGLMGGETLLIWDVKTGAVLKRLKGDFGLAPRLAFSADNRTLISMANQIILYDVRTGAEKKTIDFGSSVSRYVASGDMSTDSFFSVDGRYFVAQIFGAGAGLQIFDTRTNRPLAFIKDTFKAAAFSPDSKTLALVGQDGSMQFWSVQTGRLLVTALDVEESDWLTVAPDGRFDGTANAWRKIFWRFSSNIFDAVPVEIFFSDFYYPNLLADALGGRNVSFVQNLATKDRRQPHLTLKSASIQADAAAANARNIQLSAEIFDAPAGAQDVRLFRNGSLVKIWRGDVLQNRDRATLDATVPIVAGNNEFTAYCFNRDNVKSADATLKIVGPESLKRPATMHILAVGVDRYANPAFNLKYAVADARAFGEEVQRQQSGLKEFARVEILPLYDEQATKQNMHDAFARLRRSVQPEDAVLIYFAGHGLANEPRFYLIPHDLGYDGPRTIAALTPKLQEIYAHSFSDEELERELEGLDARMILFVIDACNSGQALEAEEKRRGPMNSRGLAQLAYEKGLYILTAAQSYQAALEAQKLGHGYLTYALIEEGLRQARADREPADGDVLVREWLNYVTERVPEMQSTEMQTRQLIQETLTIVEGEERKDAQKRSVQRPRVFYRREPEFKPLVVARPRQQRAQP
jgi:WD40 repeat protein